MKIVISTLLLAVVGCMAISVACDYLIEPEQAQGITMFLSLIWGFSCRRVAEKILGFTLAEEVKRKNEGP